MNPPNKGGVFNVHDEPESPNVHEPESPNEGAWFF